MNSVASIKKQIGQIKQQTRLTPPEFLEVEVSNKLIVDWTLVSEVGPDTSKFRVEVKR